VVDLGKVAAISGILLLVAAGSTLGGFGVGFRQGEEHGVSSERERVRSLKSSPGGIDGDLVGILAIPDMLTRVDAVREFVESQEPSNARAVAMAFRSAASYIDPASLGILVEWWARASPAEAALTFTDDFYGTRGADLVTMVVQEWARREPDAARRFVEEKLGKMFSQVPAAMDGVYTALVWGWAESGREGYWEYAESLPTGATRQRALAGIATWMLLNEGPDAVMDFSENLDPGGRESLKLQFTRRAAFVLALREPRRAGEWALGMVESPFGDGVLVQVLNQWGAIDGAAALEWARNLPVNEETDRAIWEAYRQWIRADRENALAWMEENGPGPPVLLPAVVLYIRAIAWNEPARVVDWLTYIRESDRYGEGTTLFLIQRWLKLDRESAMEWTEKADLSPQIRAKIAEINEKASAKSRGPGA